MSLSIARLLAMQERLAQVSDTPELDAELLLSYVLGKPRSYLYAWPDAEVEEVQLEQFEALLRRREKGEPVAMIIGCWEFWSLPLTVSAASIVPRPDTERLVEVALERVAGSEQGRALDLGTGTGAVALALASELPGWEITGVDRSEEAVALAKRNARDLGFNNVWLLRSDWFAALDAEPPFDLIVSNPPYIAEDDPHLWRGGLRFEPRAALVAAHEGLAAIEHIAEQAPAFLRPGGWLLLEHGYQQAERVRALLAQRGFASVQSWRDYGGNDRVSGGQWPLEQTR